jgi:photosystem I P700 chlorophyll a apoprotein A1
VQIFVEKTQSKLVLKNGHNHFSRTLAKGPKTTTWIWNLHADAHDFDSQTSSLEEVSRKIFNFGQLAVIFLWISGMHFHGAYFSNYSAWLNDPVNIKQSSQVVWPIVGQEILNGDVVVTSKVFKQLLVGSKCGVQKVSLVKLNYTGLQSVD